MRAPGREADKTIGSAAQAAFYCDWFHLLMMAANSVGNFTGLSIFDGKIMPYNSMRLNLMRDSLAHVMEQPYAFCQAYIQTKLCGHHAHEVARPQESDPKHSDHSCNEI